MIFPGKELCTIMKIMCQKSLLLTAINNVSRAVASNSTMDLLECILIETLDEDRIRLTANDTELGKETKIESQIIIPGKIALKAIVKGFNTVYSFK